MIEKNIIGFSVSSEGDSFTQGFNPETSTPLPGNFSNASSEEVSLAVDKATEAFDIYRKVSGQQKSTFLNIYKSNGCLYNDNKSRIGIISY